MVEIRITSVDEPAEEDEVAACLAAVQCFLSHEASDNEGGMNAARTGIGSDWQAAGVRSAWQAAARLESTGRTRRISDVGKLNRFGKCWQATGASDLLSIAIFLAMSIGICAPAHAQDAVTPPVVLRPPIPMPTQPAVEMPPVAGNGMTDATGTLIAPPPFAPAFTRNPALNHNASFAPNASFAHNASFAPNAAVAPNAATALQPAAPRNLDMVRVLISSNLNSIGFNLPDGALLKDMATGDVLAQLPPQSHWQIALRSPDSYPQLSFSGTTSSARFSQVLIASKNDYRRVAFTPEAPPSRQMVPIPSNLAPRFWLPAVRGVAPPYTGRAYMLVPQQDDGTIGTQGRLYRGAMMLRRNQAGGIDVVNYVGLEDYLQSVVPCEMPSAWPLEALKAQAIAARSYAIASLGKHDADGYDLKGNTEDQSYLGVSAESDATNLAVAQTHGQVLRYQGTVIPAFFHSASGGCTEVSENVWGRSLPFLKAVADYDDQSPYFSWNRTVSLPQAEQILNGSGRSVGALLALIPVSRGISPRVRFLLASGSDRSLLLTGEEARKLFNLPSSCFNVGASGSSYVFAGRGFGHGLGMSQWGARTLAESGLDSNDILNYYYKDVTVERL